VRAAGLLASALLCAAAGASAGEARILLTGVFAPELLRLSESRSFVEYAEQGSLRASYPMRHGFGGELGVEYDVTRRFGMRASVSYARRLGDGRYEARLPHPLYLDRDRLVNGSVGGLEYREAALSLDVVLILGSGPVQVSLLGGGAFFRVDAEVAGEIRKTEAYPYDTVELRGLGTRRLGASPIGYGGAVGLDWRLSRHFGLGAQARYNRARARLRASEDETIAFDAGGLQAGLGLRVIF